MEAKYGGYQLSLWEVGVSATAKAEKIQPVSIQDPPELLGITVPEDGVDIPVDEILFEAEDIAPPTPKISLNGHEENSAVRLPIGGKSFSSYVDEALIAQEQRRDDLADKLEAQKNGGLQRKTT